MVFLETVASFLKGLATGCLQQKLWDRPYRAVERVFKLYSYRLVALAVKAQETCTQINVTYCHKISEEYFKMRIALVCDSMSAYGGAERVIEQILKLFPTADLFTVLDIVPENQRAFLRGVNIQSSFLQRMPYIARYYRKMLHYWPLAVEQLDVAAYDLVISSHHSVAYGVLTRPGQVHVSYVHSPMRYAWDLQHEYLRAARLDRGVLGMIARRTLHKMRIWDYSAAQRPDAMATNSAFVAERLLKTHRRRAKVIHPPVAVEGKWRPKEAGGYYLSLGRLVPYKRIDLLARAFARMPHHRLKIVGDGPDMRKIAALGAPNVEVLGFQPDDRVRTLLGNAEAYVFAGIEDFGITAVEAQAAGTPVIAYRGGGLTETVIGLHRPNPTGLFFSEQSEEAIMAAVEAFELNRHMFSAKASVVNAARFSEQRFRDDFAAFVEESLVTLQGDPVQSSENGWCHPLSLKSSQTLSSDAMTPVSVNRLAV